MVEYEILSSVISSNGSYNLINDEDYHESYTYGVKESKEPETRYSKLKNIIFLIYSDVHDFIFSYRPLNLDEALENLNQHFRSNGIAYQKFNIYINYDELIALLDTEYYNNIRIILSGNHINNKQIINKVDDIMLSIMSRMYNILSLSSPDINFTDEDYWGVTYDFIEDLSCLFGVYFSGTESYTLVK